MDEQRSDPYALGWWDADHDLHSGAFNSSRYPMWGEPYQDGYTARWFESIPGDIVTCGNRKDWFKAQRHHTYVCLGLDITNRGEQGIVQVYVWACCVCGRDWR